MGSYGSGNPTRIMEKCLSFSSAETEANITDECWIAGEGAMKEVLNCIHPTLDSEEKRKDVIDYVQRLIKCSLGCEVFPYGSVPLKTYLPDGDIDLTVFSSSILEETLAREVLAVLQEEELKENTEYDVKDPQFIDAEVKLVKCLVQNTVIDISFNQLGGLCTLCFLEQVDRLVGKNHLFKRSIILIKAWCYYESRILGAHSGLLSTYALETLVLFIFHMFHSSLNGPLAVLHRFLDYYKKFDWDNYCISLNGPVCKSPLPGILVEMPDYKSDNLLLSEEFLRNCTEMFSVPSRGHESDTRVFQQKHLNIVDPLKENNNLGRSVNRANSVRIQRALKYGARKLEEMLLLPPDKVADDIKKFFTNTIERHRHNYLGNVQGYDLSFVDNQDTYSSISSAECYADDRMLLKSSEGDFGNSPKRDFKSVISNGLSSNLSNGVSSDMVSENGSFSYAGNGNCGPENLGQSDVSDSALWVETRDFPLESSSIYQSGTDYYCEGFCSGGSAVSSPKTSILESLSLDIEERDLAMNPLADLSGQYDSHIRSLLYGQCCCGFSSSAPVISNGPSSPSRSQNKNFWDTVRQFMPLGRHSFWQTNANGVLVGPTVQHSDNTLPSTATSSSEEKETPQGTGYFLNMERRYKGRTRNRTPRSHGQLHLHSGTHSNGCVPAISDENYFGKCTDKISAVQSSVPSQCDKLLKHSCANGFSNTSCRIEFGSLGNLPDDVLSCTSRDSILIPSAPQKVQLSKPLFSKPERGAEHPLHLKNEDEFPPLPLQKV